MEKKEYTIKRIVNWYFGNYCSRKCFDKEERLFDHYQKLKSFVEKNSNLKMTHSDFLQLFNEEMTLCTLNERFKRKMISWKLFERFKNTQNYDSDKIIIDNKSIKRIDGSLEKPVCCPLCEKLGVAP